MLHEQAFDKQRQEMVLTQLETRGITDTRVLSVMAKVKRHLFVPDNVKDSAYADNALGIHEGQTISQPYIVALMTQLAAVQPLDKVLEIGTGCGYQTAILAELSKNIYSIEISEILAQEARLRLETLGYRSVRIRQSDGARGWPEEAPFDVILVTAAPDHVPEELVKELKPQGRLVIPVGFATQDLLLIEKNAAGNVTEKSVIPVRFVPLK